MFLFSVGLFFILIFCLGYSATFFVKPQDNRLERILMNLGIGLGVFAVLSVFLNLVRIQLHWMVFLAISLVIPAFAVYKHISRQGFKGFSLDLGSLTLTKSMAYILVVLVIAAVFFAVYHKGAFTYPYLEDDDPWLHAKVAKYIAVAGTFSHDPSVKLHYIEPYPPAYAVLMGMLHQTNTNVIWTLKFFNVLLISLGIVFFYFFANAFFGDRKKAFFSTVVITLIPCFLSHFIWASSLAIVLFFPAFYCVEKIRDDKRWWILASVMVAGIFLSQPSNAVIFGLMFAIYWVVRVVTYKSFQTHIFLAGVVGLLVAIAIFYLPVFVKYGWEGIASGIGFGSTSLLHFSAAGSGGEALYTLGDFIFAKTSSKMDNPIGVGSVLFFLMVFSLVFAIYRIFHKPRQALSKENFTYWLMVLWLIFGFAGVNGNRLPVQLMPHRFWVIFAIPVSLIASEGLFAAGRLFEKVKVHRFFVFALVFIGILVTSGYPKYAVETSYWPPGVGWGSMDELGGYIKYVQPLPYNTKVFPLCSDESKVIAFDKFAEPWDPEYVRFKESAFNASVKQISTWMKLRGYNYLVVDAYCLRSHTMNETNDKLLEIGNSSNFQVSGVGKDFFMFKVFV